MNQRDPKTGRFVPDKAAKAKRAKLHEQLRRDVAAMEHKPRRLFDWITRRGMAKRVAA